VRTGKESEDRGYSLILFLINDAEAGAQTVTIYRGTGLATTDMFVVAEGAMLTIRGTGNSSSFPV